MESGDDRQRQTLTEQWLRRLAFSFVIIAMWLIWTAMHLPARTDGSSDWRRVLYLIGAGASFSLGIAGIRARHRRDRFE